MAGSLFGACFRVLNFGESHGPAVGAVIDGCPAGVKIDLSYLQSQLNRRRPGQSHLVSQRKEADKVEILSGIEDGWTLGSPIALIIRNADAKSKHYDNVQDAYRPSHADYTYDMKYGRRAVAGGGRSSARMTAGWVAAGAVAQLFLRQCSDIEVVAWVKQVEDIVLPDTGTEFTQVDVDKTPVRCPDRAVAEQMAARIEHARKNGDSLGGVIEAVIRGVPAGLGEPIYDKFEAELAKAMLAINATKGFEIGSGFCAAGMRGTAHNDPFVQSENGQIRTSSNYSGGVQGGISNGMPIQFRVAFKPTPTVMVPQQTVTRNGSPHVLQMKGRHDPCVLPRAVPIVEAMAALVCADFVLRHRLSRL